MVIHNSFSDFILFLYVHVSHSDNRYDPREIAVVKNKMQRLFPPGTDVEKKLYLAIKEYNLFDTSKINELMRDSFAFFHGDEETQKSKLYSDLKDIIKSDGHVMKAEADAFQTIKRIVDRV